MAFHFSFSAVLTWRVVFCVWSVKSSIPTLLSNSVLLAFLFISVATALLLMAFSLVIFREVSTTTSDLASHFSLSATVTWETWSLTCSLKVSFDTFLDKASFVAFVSNSLNNAWRIDKYAYYDTSSNAYYIVLIGNYYNTSALRQKDDDTAEVKEDKKQHALEIARLLSSTSSNQTDAITHYLNQYDLTFGDQKFYDYLKETYPDLDIFD